MQGVVSSPTSQTRFRPRLGEAGKNYRCNLLLTQKYQYCFLGGGGLVMGLLSVLPRSPNMQILYECVPESRQYSSPELGSSTAQLFLTLPKLNGLSNIKGPKTSRFPFSYLLLFHTRSPIFLARKDKTSSVLLILLGVGTSYFTFSVSLR